MVIDVSAKVKLQQDQLEKNKQKISTQTIQRDLEIALKKNSHQTDELCDTLIQNQDSELKKQALELRKSNKFLFLNFCHFNDLINIQNKTFTQQSKEFQPISLITSVQSQIKELFNLNPILEFDENLPKFLLGDEPRLTYILACLIKNSIGRNKECCQIKVSTCIKDDEQIDLIEVFHVYYANESYLRTTQLVITVIVYFDRLTNVQQSLKRVVKAIGGKLKVYSEFEKTSFVLLIPCKA